MCDKHWYFLFFSSLSYFIKKSAGHDPRNWFHDRPMGHDPEFEKQDWFNTILVMEAQVSFKEKAEPV